MLNPRLVVFGCMFGFGLVGLISPQIPAKGLQLALVFFGITLGVLDIETSNLTDLESEKGGESVQKSSVDSS